VTQPPDRYEYPAPYYGQGWQQPPAQQAPWDGVSIAALATGVVGLGPVPIVLGAMGATRTAGRRRRGRWMAWAGLALGVLSTLFWLAAGGIVWLLLRPLPADVSAPRFATPQQLVVGNCLATVPQDGDVWAVRVVPCADSHEATVVVRQDLSNPPTGQTRLDEAASQLCATQAPTSGRLVVWAPTPGHSTVTCLVTTTVSAPDATQSST
jgi:hypothetical protein